MYQDNLQNNLLPAPPAPPTGIDVATLNFDPATLEQSLRDSGIEDEFDVPREAQMLLVAQGLTIVALALSADDEQTFEAGLQGLDPPGNPDELAFLQGYCEHVRSAALQPFPEAAQAEIRPLLKQRVTRALQLAGDSMRGMLDS